MGGRDIQEAVALSLGNHGPEPLRAAVVGDRRGGLGLNIPVRPAAGMAGWPSCGPPSPSTPGRSG